MIDLIEFALCCPFGHILEPVRGVEDFCHVTSSWIYAD